MDTPINEYHIEKSRVPVALTLLGGARMSGQLFILATGRHASVLEDAPGFMNSVDPFFPLRRDDGSTVIISKDHVLTVDFPPEYASDWRFGDLARIEVVMQGGQVHEGEIALEHHIGHARVLDHMNRVQEPFLLLQRDGAVTLLNRTHIAYVHPLDDAAT